MFATHPMSDERLAFAQREAATTYKASLAGSVSAGTVPRHTAGLRRIKPAITALQNGSTAMGKKQYPAAREQFAAALQMVPQDYAALVMMASCQFALGDMAAAEQYARQATTVYPAEPQAHILTAVVSINRKKYDQALHHLNEYDRSLPGNPLVLFYKGYSFEGMGRQQEAAGQYNSFLKKVRSGKQAEHAYSRLKSWGYLR
jgi:beta-barrel assembly-enhancing protease